MKQMRWRIILLVLWLALVFNLERLDFEYETVVELSYSFYVLVVVTVVLFLLIPLRRRQMYLASFGMLATYAVFKALHLSSFFKGVNKYLTITEVVALLITAGITWMVSRALRDFMQAVEAISMPEGRPQLLSYDKVQERIRAEMGRARRHQRPISVAMIELDPSTFEATLHQAVRDAQAAMIARYVQVRLGLFLAKHVRGTDVIAHQADGGRFLLLAPETPSEQTRELLKRLAHEVEDQMDIRFRYSIADFPNGALTSEELLRKVTEDLQRSSPSPDASADRGVRQATDAAHDAYVAVSTSIVQEEHIDEMMLTHVADNKEAGDGARYHNGNSPKNGDSLVP
jgi:GGDEF domain-containing protein